MILYCQLENVWTGKSNVIVKYVRSNHTQEKTHKL
jgi:hypothetical protein